MLIVVYGQSVLSPNLLNTFGYGSKRGTPKTLGLVKEMFPKTYQVPCWGFLWKPKLISLLPRTLTRANMFFQHVACSKQLGTSKSFVFLNQTGLNMLWELHFGAPRVCREAHHSVAKGKKHVTTWRKDNMYWWKMENKNINHIIQIKQDS